MTRQLNVEDWKAQGLDKFGTTDVTQWRFVCPVCGNKQSAPDFVIYRRMGARADTAYQACIGRYNGVKDDATLPGCMFSTATMPGTAPVEVEYGPGHQMPVMEFADDETPSE